MKRCKHNNCEINEQMNVYDVTEISGAVKKWEGKSDIVEPTGIVIVRCRDCNKEFRFTNNLPKWVVDYLSQGGEQ